MIKFFSNPIMSYLEDDVNSFMENQKMNIIDIKYNTTQYNDELVHSVLIYYEDKENRK